MSHDALFVAILGLLGIVLSSPVATMLFQERRRKHERIMDELRRAARADKLADELAAHQQGTDAVLGGIHSLVNSNLAEAREHIARLEAQVTVLAQQLKGGEPDE